MLIDHPLLGPRDAREFVYVGDASLLGRPDPDAFESREAAIAAFHDYLYLRDNPAGLHEELWFHEQGDRSWLVVTRDTTTHRIHDVRLARDVALERRRAREADTPAADPAADPSSPSTTPARAENLSERSRTEDAPDARVESSRSGPATDPKGPGA